MFFKSVISDKCLQLKDRRSHPRRSCAPLSYADFGPNNGGMLLNLSEDGLGFQVVHTVVEGEIIHLKFALPGTSTDVEADARVARSNGSRKGGGLRFVHLSEDDREQVRAWVLGETTGETRPDSIKNEADERLACAAMTPPEFPDVNSVGSVQSPVLIAARVSEAPETMPDEPAPEVSSEQDTGDESAASADTIAATSGRCIDPTRADQATVAQVLALLEPVPARSPASTIATTDASETPREAVPSIQSLGQQTSETTGIRGEGLSDIQENVPTRQQIEGRAYEIYAKRGRQSGHEMADWLTAEKELASHIQRKAAEPSALEHEHDCRATRRFLDFHGLREQPFGMTPDPAYLYSSRTHDEALASLSFGIQDNRGFLALIAEPGMGKTTLLYQLLEDLRDSARTVFVFQTQCDSRELFQYILHELDVDAQGMGLVAMHNRLNELLFEAMRAGKRFVLVVDEAQNLDESVLETVRMLSNFETDHTKLLQIVLAGQPRLAAKLAQPQLTQLRQRIAVLNHLESFTAAEVACYIDHRLRVAGSKGKPLFAPDAVALIAHRSQGIPRNINNICYNSLLMAYARRYGAVTSETVQEIVARLDIESLAPQPMRVRC